MATLITGRSQPLARTMTHYGALPIPIAIERHASATKPIDPHRHHDFPAELAALSIGDPATPSDGAVKSLTEQLRSDLARPEQSLMTIHTSMTRQTCALVGFALGLRGHGDLPGVHAIDPQTGFLLLHDKGNDPQNIRLVWVPPVAREQLALYEEHLDSLSAWLGSPGAAELSMLRRSASAAPLFTISATRTIRPLKLSKVLTGPLWPGQPNAGRHWLRGKLSGKCSGETLAAFFGHWHKGVEPWGATSALDPNLYRADLERSLPDILCLGGWQPQRSPLA